MYDIARFKSYGTGYYLDVVWSTLQDGTSKGVDGWLWVCSNNSVAVARLPCSHPGHAWKLGNMLGQKNSKNEKMQKMVQLIEQQREKTRPMNKKQTN